MIFTGQKKVRPDGTFVIDIDNLPYHVVENDPLYLEIEAAYKEHPDEWAMEEPVLTDPKTARNTEILNELHWIDLQSIRPLRAIADGIATEDDIARLAELETRADALRAEAAELANE